MESGWIYTMEGFGRFCQIILCSKIIFPRRNIVWPQTGKLNANYIHKHYNGLYLFLHPTDENDIDAGALFEYMRYTQEKKNAIWQVFLNCVKTIYVCNYENNTIEPIVLPPNAENFWTRRRSTYAIAVTGRMGQRWRWSVAMRAFKMGVEIWLEENRMNSIFRRVSIRKYQEKKIEQGKSGTTASSCNGSAVCMQPAAVRSWLFHFNHSVKCKRAGKVKVSLTFPTSPYNKLIFLSNQSYKIS